MTKENKKSDNVEKERMDKKQPGPGGLTRAEVKTKKAQIVKMRGFGLTVEECCGTVEINPSTYFNWRNSDADFREKTKLKGEALQKMASDTNKMQMEAEKIMMARYYRGVSTGEVQTGALFHAPQAPASSRWLATRGDEDGPMTEKHHITVDQTIRKPKSAHFDEMDLEDAKGEK